MSLVKWAFIGLLVLPAAEVIIFIVVAALIGWLPAAALFVGTSVAGVMLLKRSGRGDLDRFRAAFARDGVRAVHLESPGLAAIVGGILLVLPGFLTDVLGVALFVPALRRWASARLASAARQRRRDSRDDHIIDLEPGEWRQIPDQTRGRRRKSDGGSNTPEDLSQGSPEDASGNGSTNGPKEEHKSGGKHQA
jgi:UPF0716 protein FxsA